MTPRIHLLEHHPAVRRQRARIRAVAGRALTTIRRRIPVRGVDVVIGHNPWYATPEVGIAGFAPHGSLITVWVDAESKRLERSLPVQLTRTLAHELHHVARWNTVGYGRTLREALVSEGLADHFELEVAPGRSEPWDRALTKRQLTRWLGIARRNFGNRRYNHDDWFFGSFRRGSQPRWTGYSVGFHLVGEYLAAHPGTTAAALHATPARTIVPR